MNLTENTLMRSSIYATYIKSVEQLIEVIKGQYGKVVIQLPTICVSANHMNNSSINTKSIKEYFGDIKAYYKNSEEIQSLISLYNSL